MFERLTPNLTGYQRRRMVTSILLGAIFVTVIVGVVVKIMLKVSR
jgi:hypothetical protein